MLGGDLLQQCRTPATHHHTRHRPLSVHTAHVLRAGQAARARERGQRLFVSCTDTPKQTRHFPEHTGTQPIKVSTTMSMAVTGSRRRCGVPGEAWAQLLTSAVFEDKYNFSFPSLALLPSHRKRFARGPRGKKRGPITERRSPTCRKLSVSS